MGTARKIGLDEGEKFPLDIFEGIALFGDRKAHHLDKVSFPWSMIDKITPRPAKVVEEALSSVGVEDMAPIITAKNTFIAPFGSCPC